MIYSNINIIIIILLHLALALFEPEMTTDVYFFASAVLRPTYNCLSLIRNILTHGRYKYHTRDKNINIAHGSAISSQPLLGHEGSKAADSVRPPSSPAGLLSRLKRIRGAARGGRR